MSNRFEREPEHDDEGRGSTSMMHLLGQMLMLPFTVFVYGMEMFLRSMHRVQDRADEGLELLVGTAPPEIEHEPEREARPAASTESFVTEVTVSEGTGQKEEQRKMRDTNLSDDMLKLVRYKILFVKRDYEVAFPEREDLVWENISDTALTAWKVAEFIQSLETTEVPRKWLDKNYPKERQKKTEHGRDIWYIHKLPEDDKKYLRVFFEVLDRYPREKLRYEERQLDVLEEIAKAVKEKDKNDGTTAPTTSGSTGATVP